MPSYWFARLYILGTASGQTDGDDVYGVMAMRPMTIIWSEQATTMLSFGDLRSHSRGQRGMLDPLFFLLTKDTVLHGRCQRPFLCMVMSNYSIDC